MFMVTCWVIAAGLVGLAGDILESQALLGLGAVMLLMTTCFVV